MGAYHRHPAIHAGDRWFVKIGTNPWVKVVEVLHTWVTVCEVRDQSGMERVYEYSDLKWLEKLSQD